MSISFSVYQNGFRLCLITESAKPLLELQLEEVEEIRVRRDRPTSEPTLLITARGDEGRSTVTQRVEIELEPSIKVRVKNGGIDRREDAV